MQVDGCNFHWKKSLIDNMKSKGCHYLYEDNPEFQVGLDLIKTLGLIPEDQVIQAGLFVQSNWIINAFQAL